MFYNKLSNALMLFAGILLLSSCVSSNVNESVYNKTNIASDNVRLIFNREKAFLYLALYARVEVNGKVITKLSNGSSFYYDLPAGRTNISVYGFMDPGEFSLDLNLVKSKIYEFKVQPRAASFMPMAAFGLLGSVADAQVNSQSGYFQISVAKYSDR